MDILVQGIVRHIIYVGAKDDYCVFRIIDRHDEYHTITGNLSAPRIGDEIEVKGKYVNHKKYGRQILATAFEKVMPQTYEGAIAFIERLGIHGLGKKSLERIGTYFGEDLVLVLSSQPKRFLEVPGIRNSVKEELFNTLYGQGQLDEVYHFFAKYNLSNKWVKPLVEWYGMNCIEIIQKNPYHLLRLFPDFHFRMADGLAKSLGFSPDADIRIEAGIYSLLRSIDEKGHTCLPIDQLIGEVYELLGGYEEAIVNTLEKWIGEEQLIYCEYEHMQYIYPLHLYHAEVYATERTKEFLMRPVDHIYIDMDCFFKEFEEKNAIRLGEQQKAAIYMGIENKMSLITGGPGTGKTTIIKGLVEAFQKILLSRIVLCAPTGRAAKRLSEATSYTATTIHRLLMPIGESTYEFSKNEEDPLDVDVVIVDEASMLNLQLFDALLRAIPDEAYVILVGDIDQLPPIGAGFVLHDLMKSNKLPYKRLEDIYRQKDGNKIVENAYRINHGQMPLLDNDKEFIFLEARDMDSLFQQLWSVYSEALEEAEDTLDVQIIAPKRRGALGSVRISEYIQQQIHQSSHKGISIHGQKLYVGDKVIQNVNNYDLEVYNGEVGTVCSVSKSTLGVQFIDKQVFMDFDEATSLSLAYAITVHKSQGSEYGTVIIPFVRPYRPMLQRNLLYTAITRAREKVVLIGTKGAIEEAIDTLDGKQRNTLFLERLQGRLGEEDE